MEFFNLCKAAPKPCLCCNHTEMDILQEELKKGKEDFWIYRVPVTQSCNRCRDDASTVNCQIGFGALGLLVWKFFPDDSKPIQTAIGIAGATALACLALKARTNQRKVVEIPVKAETVGIVERAIHAASVGEKGSEYRAHGTFVKHLVGIKTEEVYKQSLIAWVPTAMMAFMMNYQGVSRTLRKATPEPPSPQSTLDSSTGSDNKCDVKPEEQNEDGNPDITNGIMVGTQLQGDEYGKEDRIRGETIDLAPKNGAFQVGPDLIPTEVMDSTEGNLKAGLAKRVQPLPFQASPSLLRKIDKTVTTLIKEIFTPERIQSWREGTSFEEIKSSKWSSQRWREAVDQALAETAPKIEQTFQIKTNEALPAKGKAPRPIIQCGDVAQVMMKYPVKCFEDLLFEFFEEASIKHVPKHEAMGRIANHLRMRGANVIEGDGSAWDACCNETIRDLTENRVIEHIIEVLGEDPEVPKQWMKEMLRDMKKKKIAGKAKVNGWENSILRVIIDSIRQSGHTGTSCFNWFINFICWICVLADQPWKLIGKSQKSGNLFTRYRSARDHKEYKLKYAFEGDDSAISSTENLKQHSVSIEQEWKSMGFRMKLVYVTDKMTFTGFDFRCDSDGPTHVFIPEIPRNIASSSWSCSSELKMKPYKIHQIGAAAMLARAENFKDCGAYSRYFAALGLAHMRRIEDFGLSESDAIGLGIRVSPSVKNSLQDLYDAADCMSDDMRALVDSIAPMSHEDELRLLSCDFGTDPLNSQLARELIPVSIWDPKNFEKARR